MNTNDFVPSPYGWGVPCRHEEQWSVQPPSRGDHIRVQRMGGLYSHHGIYVSDEEVIHFTGDDDDSIFDWSKAHVISTTLSHFLDGGTLEIKIYTDEELADLYPVEGIINYARACLGDGGYNLVFNNCEHFANACTLGQYRSYQVENFIRGKEPMGFWGKVKDFFFGSSSGSSSGSRETTNYNYSYEPDKLRIAEIEADLKVKLADKEQERIALVRDAQIDILKTQAMSQAAIEKARAQGRADFAQQLVELQKKLLEVEEQRLDIIEKGSLPIVQQIEAFYEQEGDKIQTDREAYNKEKLPLLLDTLKQYDKDSMEYTLYSRQIENDMQLQNQFISKQLDRIAVRQKQVLDSFLSSKEQLHNHTAQLTTQLVQGYLEDMKASAAALPAGQAANLLTTNDHQRLSGNSKSMLETGKK